MDDDDCPPHCPKCGRFLRGHDYLDQGSSERVEWHCKVHGRVRDESF